MGDKVGDKQTQKYSNIPIQRGSSEESISNFLIALDLWRRSRVSLWKLSYWEFSMLHHLRIHVITTGYVIFVLVH